MSRSWPEIGVAAAGVEHNPATHAVQHLFVALLVPAVSVAWSIALAVRGEALRAHECDDLVLAHWRPGMLIASLLLVVSLRIGSIPSGTPGMEKPSQGLCTSATRRSTSWVLVSSRHLDSAHSGLGGRWASSCSMLEADAPLRLARTSGLATKGTPSSRSSAHAGWIATAT